MHITFLGYKPKKPLKKLKKNNKKQLLILEKKTCFCTPEYSTHISDFYHTNLTIIIYN